MRFTFLSLIIFLFTVNNSTLAQTANVFIPDSNFKTALIDNSSINTNMDDEIQLVEANEYAESIDVNYLGIADLTGIEAFVNITSLNCRGNILSEINISSNLALTELNCSFNQIKSLDITSNTFLVSLDCSSNMEFTNLNMKNGANFRIENFIAANNPKLRCITVDDVEWSTKNWLNIDPAAYFSKDCSAEIVLFNDLTFKAALINDPLINVNMDDEIQIYEANEYTGSIDVSFKNIYDLTGIEAFKNITSLDCSYNQLTRLDITNNRALKKLDCSSNRINTFLPEYPGFLPPWENNFELEELICNSNELTQLNIGFYPKLTRLDCMVNRLSNLDFNNPFPHFPLIALNCRGNGLKSLDVSNLLELRTLDCSDNWQLSSLITNPNGFSYMNLNLLMCENTRLTSLDLTNFNNLTSLNCSFNMELKELYMKNGNNYNINQFSAYYNPKLTCIEVDDPEWSTQNWKNIDAGTHFSENCPVLWTGNTSSEWSNKDNWSRGYVPMEKDNVVIPSKNSPDPPYMRMNDPVIDTNDPYEIYCNSLTINPDASLTIGNGKALTVKTKTINDGQLFINNDNSQSGSLITESASGNGLTSIGIYLTTGAWHHVSSPLAGQTISDFLLSNPFIPAKSDFRAMKDYNPALNDWNDYFTNSSEGNLGGGKGFSMRVDGPPIFEGQGNIISFKGYLQAGIQTVVTHANSWNLVGNPYTSAIGLTINSMSMANFLSENADVLDPSYAAIYVWDKPDANNGMAGQYRVISNCPSEFADAAIGQAFFVKMDPTATSVKFTPEMQLHSPYLTLKSAKGSWSNITLEAAANNLKSSTAIVFNEAMTKGLDPTYDAGLLKGDADLIIYSKLVQDNGISFAVQALPDDDFTNMVIPLGIEYKTGGVVTFTSKTFNLPADCKIILEDKQTKTIVDLSDKAYTFELPANSSVPNRFFLHTSNLTTDIKDLTREIESELNAYFVNNNEIKIVGHIDQQSIATLYDIQGKEIFVKALKEGSINSISASNLRGGIYMLSIKNNHHMKGFKIVVTD